jgi:hypothetical protein
MKPSKILHLKYDTARPSTKYLNRAMSNKPDAVFNFTNFKLCALERSKNVL